MSGEEFTASYSGNDTQFKGIMAGLRDRGNGNPSETGLVEIVSPTTSIPEYPLKYLVEYTDLLDKCYWNFANYDPKESENWILFDFKPGHKVKIDAYTLRSGGSSHPKSWRIEGSDDNEKWELFHEVRDCKELNGPRKTMTYKLEKEATPVRYIRYVQTENQSTKPERKYRINLKAIEFFGDYIPAA